MALVKADGRHLCGSVDAVIFMGSCTAAAYGTVQTKKNAHTRVQTAPSDIL